MSYQKCNFDGGGGTSKIVGRCRVQERFILHLESSSQDPTKREVDATKTRPSVPIMLISSVFLVGGKFPPSY